MRQWTEWLYKCLMALAYQPCGHYINFAVGHRLELVMQAVIDEREKQDVTG